MNLHNAMEEALNSYMHLTSQDSETFSKTKSLANKLDRLGFRVKMLTINLDAEGTSLADCLLGLNEYLKEVLRECSSPLISTAEETGIPYTLLSTWRSKKGRELSFSNLLLLADHLGVQLPVYSVAPYSLTYAGSK